MLSIAVHEQYGAQAGVIEAGEQRRLLAEIARQGTTIERPASAIPRDRAGAPVPPARVIASDAISRAS
jgi:hypothetical protein